MAHFEVSRGQHFEAAPRLPTITKLKEPIVWIEVVPKKKVLPRVVWWKNRIYQAGLVALLVVGLLMAFSRISHAQGFANVPGGFQILPPLATVTQPGLVQPDGTTITITSAGVISSTGGGGIGCTIANSTGIVYNTAGTCTTDTNAVLSAGTLSLGASGTLGDFVLGNATSGTITLEPVTGALGSVTLKLPAASDTLIGKATTDTLTNKTFDTAGTGNVFDINGTGITAVTGSGSVVLATSPTLVTPTLGAATATSINGNTFTSGTYTLTGTAGKTLDFTNTLTLSGTDSTTMTFPSSSDTVVTLAATQALTNKTYNGNTFTAGTGTLTIAAGKTLTDTSGTGAVALKGATGGGFAQAACGDLSNGATSCSTDTTNASNITSGSLPVGQIAGSAASHAVPVDVGGTSTYKVIPNCTDSGGNHINYTQSTDAFSCGTSSSGGGGSGSFAIMGFAATVQNATKYSVLSGTNQIGASESVGAQPMAAPRTLGAISGVTSSGLYVALAAGTTIASGQTATFTLRVNNGSPASGPTCTITGTATSCSDTTHSATVTAGQTVDMLIVTSATSGAIDADWAIDAQ